MRAETGKGVVGGARGHRQVKGVVGGARGHRLVLKGVVGGARGHKAIDRYIICKGIVGGGREGRRGAIDLRYNFQFCI